MTKKLFEIKVKELVLRGMQGELSADAMINVFGEESLNLLITQSEVIEQVVNGREGELKRLAKRARKWDRVMNGIDKVKR